MSEGVIECKGGREGGRQHGERGIESDRSKWKEKVGGGSRQHGLGERVEDAMHGGAEEDPLVLRLLEGEVGYGHYCPAMLVKLPSLEHRGSGCTHCREGEEVLRPIDLDSNLRRQQANGRPCMWHTVWLRA